MGYPNIEEMPLDADDKGLTEEPNPKPSEPGGDSKGDEAPDDPEDDEEEDPSLSTYKLGEGAAPGRAEVLVDPSGVVRDPVFDYLVSDSPCEACLANKDGGPYKDSDITGRFPEAVRLAPDLYTVNQHPNCKCTLKRRYEPDEVPPPVYVDRPA